MDPAMLSLVAKVTIGIGVVLVGGPLLVAFLRHHKTPDTAAMIAPLVLALGFSGFAQVQEGAMAAAFYALSAVSVGIGIGIFSVRFVLDGHYANLSARGDTKPSSSEAVGQKK